MSHEEPLRMESPNPQLSSGDAPAALSPLPPIPSIGPLNEATLLRVIAAKDYRHALTLCTRLHGLRLGRFCMALLGSQPEADDLLQETLLAAYAGFPGFRAESSVLGWLMGIARKKCARQVEKKLAHSSLLASAPAPEDVPGGAELLAERQRAERIRTALSAVKPSEREALVLRYVSELSYSDVALACGIDEAAARKRVSRALMQLRTLLGKQE